MRLWVDADACPRDAKELIYRAAGRFEIPTVLVANAALSLPRLAHVSLMRVKQGLDIADAAIVQESQAGDVAITADVPLAALLVAKGVEVIDPRGDVYSPDTVAQRLAMRDFMQNLRDSGIPTEGPKAYGQKDRQAFANALDRVLTAAKRKAT